MHTPRFYPNDWEAPYALPRRASGYAQAARFWLVGALGGAMLNYVFLAAWLGHIFTVTEFLGFMAGTGALVLGMAARYYHLCLKSRRLTQVHDVWRTMQDRPHAWREFALAQKAYEYARHDGTWHLGLGLNALFGSVLSLVLVHAFFYAWEKPLSGYEWFMASAGTVAVVAGSIWAWSRHRARGRLNRVLGLDGKPRMLETPGA